MTATPNHALQRTAPAVTLAASAAAWPPAMQPARQPPQSLSLGSLGVSTRVLMRQLLLTKFLGALFLLGKLHAAEVMDNSALPKCTKVEVLSLDPEELRLPDGRARPRGEKPQDVASYWVPTESYWCKLRGLKVYEGESAEVIAQLWRALNPKILPGGVMTRALCHTPGFAYRFYAGDVLLAESTVCWKCFNFQIIVGEAHREKSFDTASDTAKQLLKVSERSFQASSP